MTNRMSGSRSPPTSRLRYLEGTKDRIAGFYPADERRAAELAYAAKRKSQDKSDVSSVTTNDILSQLT